jgi:hypothetical protein
MDDVARWLDGLGLDQYAQAFADNAVGLADLQHLTDEDLTSLGLPLGPEGGCRPRSRRGVGASIERQAEIGRDTTAESAEEASHAERRPLTVLFCDLVNSTVLSRQLDPEDMARVMGAYQDEVAREVARYDGHVAKFLGDGVLAYFGWPRAHVDDAERAVRAGLSLTEAVSRLQTPAGDRWWRGRIATGLVVVDDAAGRAGRTRTRSSRNRTSRPASRPSPGLVTSWSVRIRGAFSANCSSSRASAAMTSKAFPSP